jgi:hypothetical protein
MPIATKNCLTTVSDWSCQEVSYVFWRFNLTHYYLWICGHGEGYYLEFATKGDFCQRVVNKSLIWRDVGQNNSDVV